MVTVVLVALMDLAVMVPACRSARRTGQQRSPFCPAAAASNGSNNCRATPNEKPPSSSPPRPDKTRMPASPARSLASLSKELLPIPAGPVTTSTPPVPARAPSSSPPIRPSSPARSNRSSSIKSPALPADAAPSRPHPAVRSRYRPRSAFLLVLERELQLRTIGDPPAIIQVNVLLNDLSDPQIADCPSSGPDRLR